ncbi:MAG: hypothetical protein ACOYKE_01765 [Ferruginibacter sp.]
MTMKKKVLFVSHPKANCGVYEFGLNLSESLQHSKDLSVARIEISSLTELNTAIEKEKPSLIIYNYHPAVMPWIATKIFKGCYRNNVANIAIPQLGIIHEITQQVADTATNYKRNLIFGSSEKLSNSLFDGYIAPDPTLLLKNPVVYKTGRLIPPYSGVVNVPNHTVVGSFGFGTPNKGFEKIVELVQQEMDVAEIRFNIPFADFGDKDGAGAKQIASNCQALINKPGIKLTVTHDYLNNFEILDFLAGNSINVFLYENAGNRGISSATDYALAVQRPIATSQSSMFRHLSDAQPSIQIGKNSLTTIMQNGIEPLRTLYTSWDVQHICWEYERIAASFLFKCDNPEKPQMGIIRTVQSFWNRIFSIPDKSFTWLRNSDKATEDDLSILLNEQYTPVEIPSSTSLNRILDNDARSLYAPAIHKLFKLVPLTMSKKIAEANVQQAFVFDTVMRFIPQYNNPKMLCVGSYEDTASLGLTKLGYTVEEIDPMINYFLQEYFTKPSVKKNSYDIIFSTSVIEHDPNDESFVSCINDLLSSGGVAVITCDYKDGWKMGEPKPEVDARFYVKKDLEERLLKFMPDCYLVDNPNWNCENPDFNYLGKYQYTFATFVVKKK